MKAIDIITHVKLCRYEELRAEDCALIEAARQATYRSYAPYSRFYVGAAVRLADGSIVIGTNQENAAYPSGLCAERTALFAAGTQHPELAIDTLAIAAQHNNTFLEEPITPCGACRQVMIESESRQQTPIRLLLYGTRTVYVINGLQQLLPLSFGASSLV